MQHKITVSYPVPCCYMNETQNYPYMHNCTLLCFICSCREWDELIRLPVHSCLPLGWGTPPWESQDEDQSVCGYVWVCVWGGGGECVHACMWVGGMLERVQKEKTRGHSWETITRLLKYLFSWAWASSTLVSWTVDFLYIIYCTNKYKKHHPCIFFTPEYN